MNTPNVHELYTSVQVSKAGPDYRWTFAGYQPKLGERTLSLLEELFASSDQGIEVEVTTVLTKGLLNIGIRKETYVPKLD